MHRYYCEEWEGNRQNHRQSADFEFRILPPWFRYTIIDWDERCTWTLTNNHFNLQSRESLESLRPSDSWTLTNGFRANGWFRAIEPATITLGNEIRVWLEVDINWNTAWINITGVVDGNHLLFSMRPPRGRSSWIYGNERPPEPVYLRADGSPEPIIGQPPEPQAAPDESRSSADVPPDDDVEDARPYSNQESFVHAETEIVDEIMAGMMLFMRPPVGAIPFSRISRPIPNHLRGLITQRAITLDELDPYGLLGFEVGMLIVRSINQVRLDENTGTHLPPDSVPPRPVPVIHRNGQPVIIERPNDLASITTPPSVPTANQLSTLPVLTRPSEAPAPTVGSVFIPPPPVLAKPRPPERPPPIRFAPSITIARPSAAQSLNFHVLSNIDIHMHPRLQPVTLLPNHLRVPPVITRTGTVHPPLPVIDDSSSVSSSPPSPLRTTESGIRLEITPVSMMQQSRPEVVPVIPRNHVIRDPSPDFYGDPEVNPEA